MKYLISGWYGFNNIGDEAILAAIVKEIKAQDEQATFRVLSFFPQQTTSVHNIPATLQFPYGYRDYIKFFAYNFWLLIFSFIWADNFILGGGGFLSDWQKEAPLYWLRQLRIAKLFRCKTSVYKIGAGPFKTDLGKSTVKKYLEKYADKIVVRDQISKNWLLECHVSNPIDVQIDPVAHLQSFSFTPSKTKTIALVYTTHFDSKDLWDSNESWKNLLLCYNEQIATIRKHGFKIKLVFFQKKVESDLAADLLRSNSDISILFPETYSEVFSIFQSVDAIISFRLHGNIMAFCAKKPFLPIIYHHKGQGFIDMAKFPPAAPILSVGDEYNWAGTDFAPETWAQRTQSFLNSLTSNIWEDYYVDDRK